METENNPNTTEKGVPKAVLKKIKGKISEDELIRKRREHQEAINIKKATNTRSKIDRKLAMIEKEMMEGRGYNINDPVEKEELEELGIYKKAFNLVVSLMGKAQFEKELRTAFGDDDDDMFITVGF